MALAEIHRQMKWLGIALGLFGVLTARAGYLHTGGVQMMNGDDQAIYLRGVDLGCWLGRSFT